MSTPPALTGEQAAEAHVLYAAGAKLRELADLYGCSPQSIARAIRRAGGTIRPRGGNIDNLTKGQRR